MGCFVFLGLCAESDCIQLQTKITSGPWKGEKEGGKIYVCRITDAGRCKCCVVSSCIMCESINDLKKQQTQCNLFLWFSHLLPDLLVMNVQPCHLLPSRCTLWELWVIFLSWKSTQKYLQTFMKKSLSNSYCKHCTAVVSTSYLLRILWVHCLLKLWCLLS